MLVKFAPSLSTTYMNGKQWLNSALTTVCEILCMEFTCKEKGLQSDFY